MSSSYTSNLRLVLPVQGELSGTWGDTVNTGLTNLTDSAIAGQSTVSVTSAAQALTIVNGGADQSRVAILNLTTTTTANFAVYAPPVSKIYHIRNASAYVATIYNSTAAGNTTAAGAGVAIPAGYTQTIFSDGTNFYLASPASVTQAWADATTLNATTAFVDRLRDILPNSQTTNYALALSDRGMSVDYSGATPATITIPTNASVPFPVGSVVTITNNSVNVVTIAISTDTLRLAGTLTTGSRSLANYGVAFLRKIATTTWIISGTGVS